MLEPNAIANAIAINIQVIYLVILRRISKAPFSPLADEVHNGILVASLQMPADDRGPQAFGGSSAVSQQWPGGPRCPTGMGRLRWSSGSPTDQLVWVSSCLWRERSAHKNCPSLETGDKEGLQKGHEERCSWRRKDGLLYQAVSIDGRAEELQLLPLIAIEG